MTADRALRLQMSLISAIHMHIALHYNSENQIIIMLISKKNNFQGIF